MTDYKKLSGIFLPDEGDAFILELGVTFDRKERRIVELSVTAIGTTAVKAIIPEEAQNETPLPRN